MISGVRAVFELIVQVNKTRRFDLVRTPSIHPHLEH